MVTEQSIVVADKQHVSSDLGEETILLSLSNGVYYGLNDTGARIWELIQESTPVSTIQRVLQEEYEVAPDQCKQDVLTVLEAFENNQLIDVFELSYVPR